LRAVIEVSERMGLRDLVSETRVILKDTLVILDAAEACTKMDVQLGAE